MHTICPACLRRHTTEGRYCPRCGTALEFDLTGQTIAGRQVTGVVGGGGVGLVYRAVSVESGRREALKVLRAEHMDAAPIRARFEEEGRIGAYVRSDRLCRVHGAATTPDGRPCLFLELLDGCTLRALVSRAGPLAPDRAARLAADACDALSALHTAGIVHRDVKPENVFVCGDDEGERAMLLDTGIAATAARPSPLTAPGTTVGSPGHMAPEQVRGEPVTPRSDLYALGICLHYALTGENPFVSGVADAIEAARRQLDLSPSAPEVIAERRPDVLAAVVARLLRKDPAERFCDAATVARILRGWVELQDAPPPRAAPPFRIALFCLASSAAGALLSSRYFG